MIRWFKQRMAQRKTHDAKQGDLVRDRDITRDLLRELKASNANMAKAKAKPSLDEPLFNVVEHSDRKITVTFTTSQASRHDTMLEVARRLDAIYSTDPLPRTPSERRCARHSLLFGCFR